MGQEDESGRIISEKGYCFGCGDRLSWWHRSVESVDDGVLWHLKCAKTVARWKHDAYWEPEK